MANFSAADAAFSGVRFIKNHPKTILSWAVAYVFVFLVFAGLFMAAAGGGVIAAVRAGTDFEKHPEAFLALIPGMLGGIGVLIVLGVLISGVLLGAAFRAYLRPQEGGFGYFRFGGAELRLIGVYLLFQLIELAVATGAQILKAGVVQGGGVGAAAISGLLQLIIFCLWMFVSVRLSLAMPATFATGRIALGESWRLTKGRFWKMFGTYLLTVVAALLVILVFVVVFAAVIGALAAMASNGGAAGGTAVTLAILVGALAVLAYPLMGAAMMAVLTGPSAEIYKALTVQSQTADVFI